MKCRSCGEELVAEKRFCPSCGCAVESLAPTVPLPQAGAAPAPARVSDVAAAQPARFLPGTMVAGRYRIVAEVGRGGMGEVYRADDLRLGQPVALKFLPQALTRDPAALARLHREVRMARQVSHPNVCRVFDVGDADGVPFLSMEFVDGEDLGSLLHRIGRLPQDKALQVAHQLCAGVAEAHAFGVLHRDLKPANIMLDGRGNVRITDFGLAATAEDLGGEDARAGTPAYMAPEQLLGEKATPQGDIYALGLVLYQLFTGREPYPGATLADILAQRHKGAPARISSVVKGLDPAIERVIFQCLERDPRSRPRSVLAVAAALPGRDPLSAAIAAGETPSPELVAAATDEPLISVGRLWLVLAALVVGLGIFGFLVQKGSVLGLAPLEKSPEAMAEHARQLLQRLGYTAPPRDTAYWYEADSGYLNYRANRGRTPEQARQLRSAVPAPMQFIYRQSPRELLAFTGYGYMGGLYLGVTLNEPPDDTAGMISLVLDGSGRLLSFSAVPPQMEPESIASSQPDWTPLLSAAGLDEKALTPSAPKWLPRAGFDSRAAWDSVLGGEPVHIVAAAYRGTPVYFRMLAPWTPVERAAPASAPLTERIFRVAFPSLAFLTMLAALLLARKNVRLGRGDRKGATRLATVVLVSMLMEWLFLARHVPAATEYVNFVLGAGLSLYNAAYVYLAYLAVEPYVRRRWPKMLISWTRVLAGRFSDPRVGRDLLAGCLAGVFTGLIVLTEFALPTWFNVPGQRPYYPVYDSALRGWTGALGLVGLSLFAALALPLAIAVGLLLVRFVARHQWLAVILWIVISTPVYLLGERPVIAVPAAFVVAAAYVLVLVRFGLLGSAAMSLTHFLLVRCVLTVNPSVWYFWPSVLALAILAALVVHGFRIALAGRPAFGQPVLED